MPLKSKGAAYGYSEAKRKKTTAQQYGKRGFAERRTIEFMPGYASHETPGVSNATANTL